MSACPPSDLQSLMRHERQAPRYTSYPTAPQFHENFSGNDFRQHCLNSNEDPIPRQISLYAHMPFCFSPCFYCGCNKIVTHDIKRTELYLQRLKREMQMASLLLDRDRKVIQLHLGGGTPNFFSVNQIAELMDCASHYFCLSKSKDRDFSIEIDPRYVDADAIEALAFMGFNRASLGVQDVDPAVQKAVNRIQPIEQTMLVMDACRKSGMRSINVDLIYGLPHQSEQSFATTLDSVLQMRPDRFAIYSYAHMPELFRAQRQIDESTLPAPETKLQLLQIAIDKLTGAGYQYIGMDHFALPEEDLSIAQREGSLHRNFMGYTTHAETDLIGVGVSAISQVGNCYSQNFRDLKSWEAAIEARELPSWRGLMLSDDDVIRAEVIQQLMCHAVIDMKKIEHRFDIHFTAYFQKEMQQLITLQNKGLLRIEDTKISATETGRLLLRTIASCFDAYLGQQRSVVTHLAKRA